MNAQQKAQYRANKQLVLEARMVMVEDLQRRITQEQEHGNRPQFLLAVIEVIEKVQKMRLRVRRPK